MKKSTEDAIALFFNPSQWIDPLLRREVPGTERPNVFRITAPATLESVVPPDLMVKNRKVAVIGIHPMGIAAAFHINSQGCRVTLLPSGVETAEVRKRTGDEEVVSFFATQGIILRTQAAKKLRGSQIHCQSGYCGFVCEGRFIEESEEVGCIITEGDTVYADLVILVDA